MTEQPCTLTAVVSSARQSMEDRAAAVPAQQLWFHADCLAQHLTADVPWDSEAFLD